MPILAPALALLLAEAALPAAEAPASAQASPASAQANEVIRTRLDEQRRMTVPVRIGTQGPFHFVIDTGSQTTVLSTALAAELAIRPSRTARIIGIGGTGTVETARVDQLHLGRRSFADLEVALLEQQYIGSDGIVGIDSLQRQRVLLDFGKNRITVGDARSTGGNSGFEIVVTARRKRGQLIMTDALIDGVRADVIIDTGADTSIGNRALQKAMSRRKTAEQVTLTDVTGQTITADIGYPRKLVIGGIDINNLLVAYTDAPVFDVLDLNRRPALMLGMRELRLFKRIAVDFSTRRVYFDTPDAL
jgi:predicted aspartyl protease